MNPTFAGGNCPQCGCSMGHSHGSMGMRQGGFAGMPSGQAWGYPSGFSNPGTGGWYGTYPSGQGWTPGFGFQGFQGGFPWSGFQGGFPGFMGGFPGFQGGQPGWMGGFGPMGFGGFGPGAMQPWGGTFPPAFAGAGLPTDGEITDMIYDAIDADPLVPWDASIDVNVDAGTVTLTGTVPNKRIKHAAGDDAWWVSGVTDVQNNLQVSGRTRSRGTQQSTGQTTSSGSSRSRGSATS